MRQLTHHISSLERQVNKLEMGMGSKVNEARRRTVGNFLRKARVKANLTQWDVAQFCGWTTAQYVSNFERGLSLPPIKKLPIIAKIYHLSQREIAQIYKAFRQREIEMEQEEMLKVFRKRA